MSQLFIVTDVFNITGRGCVVSGSIQEGVFRIGDPIKILRNGVLEGKTTIAGVEMIHYSNRSIPKDGTIGFLLKELDKNNILAGDIIMADD